MPTLKPMRRMGLYLIALSLALCGGSYGLYQLAGGRIFLLALASPVLVSLGLGMAAFPGNVEAKEDEPLSLVHDWERLWTQTHRRWRVVWLLAVTLGVALALLAFMYWLVQSEGQLL